ncbi:hypothetical protein ACIP2X_09495 [Streptomyces sp. NPDC089424]|uniref:hypothetical protein n=1 Tax=Streptomyces sp. NPDC089424 TaxID=3365917 RepID=UPI0038039F21
MPSRDEEREVRRAGVLLAAVSAAVLVVAGLFFGFPWQVSLLLVVVSAVTAVVITWMTLGQVRRSAQRKAQTQSILSAWADLNEGRFGTASAAFTGGTPRWELPASPRFSGELLAVGRRDGVEVGVVCSMEDRGEAGVALTTVMVLLPEEGPPARPHRGKARELGLPYGVDAVETSGHELRVRYEGWPESAPVLRTMVDAAVRLATDPHTG